MIPAGIHPSALINEPPYHRAFRIPSDRDVWYRPMIDASALLEAYVVVCAGVERTTRIGARSWLMSHVHIGHDVVVGDDCIICPMSSIAGHVTIGDRVRIDQGVTVKPFVTIGDGARLGMGAVVIRDVPAGETWVGNPARRIATAPPSEVLTDSELAGWEQIAGAVVT